MTQRTTRNSRRAAGLEDSFTILNYSESSTPSTHTPSHPPTLLPMSSAHQLAQPEITHVQPGNIQVEPTEHAGSDDTPDETPDETLPVAPEDMDAIRFITAIDRVIQAR